MENNILGTSRTQTLLGLIISGTCLLVASRYHLKILFWVSLVTILWYTLSLGLAAVRHFQRKQNQEKLRMNS
jgi:hypothetical protein